MLKELMEMTVISSNQCRKCTCANVPSSDMQLVEEIIAISRFRVSSVKIYSRLKMRVLRRLVFLSYFANVLLFSHHEEGKEKSMDTMYF